MRISIPSQLLVHNPEEVTYTSVTTSTNTSAAFYDAVRYPVSLKEAAASNGVYRTDDIIWTVSTCSLSNAGLTPKPRDYITYDSKTYTVLECVKSPVLAFWRFVTRDLTLSADLQDTITIYTPTVTLDAAGGQSRSWGAVHSSIAARVQPITVDDLSERGMRTTRVRYDVTVGQDVTVKNTAGDWGRIVWGSKTLEITGYRQAERIDALPVIEATEEP